MRLRHSYAIAACVASLMGTTSAAQAQTLLGSEIPFEYSRGRNISVQERARPGYDPIGVNLGSFLAYPTATIGTEYESNVFATQANLTSDAYMLVRPAIALNSQWSRHSLTMSGGAQLVRYFKQTSQDRETWNVGTNGRLDINSDAALYADARVATLVESRFSETGLVDIATPLQYRQAEGKLRGEYRTGRTRLVLAGDYTRFTFSSVTTLSGITLSQSARDREVGRATVQLEYALSPSFAVFGQGNYTSTFYDDDLAGGALNRDSDSIRGIIGVSMDVAALLRGSFGIGHTQRNYKAAQYKDAGNLAIEARLEYFLSERTTATLTGRRSLEDAAAIGAGGFVNTGVSVHVDHEVRSNIILTGDAGYQNVNYNGLPDHANVWNVGLGGRYLLNSWLGVGLNLSHSRRSGSGLATRPYFKQTVAGISLNIQR
jgi:hypothetical protein